MTTTPSTSEPYTIRVTFYSYEKVLKRSFEIVELHRSYADASLRAKALNWTIQVVEPLPFPIASR